MKSHSDYPDTFDPAPPDKPVRFSIICKQSPGATFDDFRGLTLKNVPDAIPSRDVLSKVAHWLQDHGFMVPLMPGPGPVVCAHGPASLFQQVFQTRLQLLTRRVKRHGSERVVTAIVRDRASSVPVIPPDLDALYIAIASPPLYMGQETPPSDKGFNLHLPGDIAQLTRSSATHRLAVSGGLRATGAGPVVALIDTGFAPHPYYVDHGYHIKRYCPDNSVDPSQDELQHGTSILANVFACAPDVVVHGIKNVIDPVWSLLYSLTLQPAPKVISLSFAYPLMAQTSLPDIYVPLRFTILAMVYWGITFVAAAGDTADFMGFPSMMPEVIAVGGVKVDENDKLSRWPQSPSYMSLIYPGRAVPDLCGIASEMWLPLAPANPGDPYDWEPGEGETSAATPQIAGIAALLLQKNPSLSPFSVRNVLMEKAQWVGPGTGAGFVDALAAWSAL